MKTVKPPPIDRKKARKPPQWMVDHAICRTDESYVLQAQADTLEWHLADSGRLMLCLEGAGRNHRPVTSIDRARMTQQDCYDWLWRRGLVEIRKLGREFYLEICLDRRGLGARDFID